MNYKEDTFFLIALDLDVQVRATNTSLNCSFDHGLCYTMDFLTTTSNLKWNLAARDIIHENIYAPEIDGKENGVKHLCPSLSMVHESFSSIRSQYSLQTNTANDDRIELQ